MRSGLLKAGKVSLFIGGGALAAHFGLISLELPAWAVKMTENWGPGFLMVGIVMSGLFYYVPRSTVRDFVKSQQDLAVGMYSLSEGVKEIAGQDSKLDEMLINQRLITDRLGRIEGLIINGSRTSPS